MSEVKYLYGAAVQGIQGFIFQTNKLREIVGASELVEEICTSKFAKLLGNNGYYPDLKKQLEDDENCILHAAGNIKYIFDKKEECEKIVREFPKVIYEFAPGVTVSQAVVKFDGNDFEKAVNELEKRLRTQRNKPMRSATLGLMGIERSRQTGLPVVYVEDENTHLDAGTFAKLQYVWETKDGKRTAKRHTTKNLCQKAFYDDVKDGQIAYDIEDVTQNNDWIAIIHADGNGLGQVVQKVGKDQKLFKQFSEKLDEATTLSAREAFEAVKNQFNNSKKKPDFIPIRPIVLGGDDLTVICRADLALDYVTTFMSRFEDNTHKMLKDDNGESLLKDVFANETNKRLTACAGIAYIKSSFPFYYGYNLAETLCSLAKKDAKDSDEIREGKKLPKSCLMFHKVQDSFTEDWSAIAKRELTPQENISFQYGPYYINKAKDDRWLVENLKQKVNKLDYGKEGNAVKSHLRQWMSLLHDNPEMAKQKLLRLKSMTTNNELLNLIKDVTFEYKNKDEQYKSPVYDILAIHTINNQTTKEVEK
jgi:hypothetical protein